MKKYPTTTGFRRSRPAAEGPARPGRLTVRSLTAALVLTGFVGIATAQVTKQTADVTGQGPGGPVVSAEGATLWRSDTGLTISFRMPTPLPGTYIYPAPSAFQPDVFEGHPEAFSLWAFVFNFPELCNGPCGIDDLGPAPAMGGAFNVGGHLVGGPNLQWTGHVSINSSPFLGSRLLEPRTAEVHVAVAPHGALQPDVMPLQITTPIGTPAHWWLAFFLPD